MSVQDKEKTCFVISPIGRRGDPVRLRSDQVLRHIIEPVVSKLGYKKPVRADHIAEPGMIPHQIIQRLLEDNLVVADLTGHNPNVFYELAIRHAIRGAVVLLIAQDENPPFDVSQSRAIKFDFRDMDSVADCKTELERQIRSLEEHPNEVFSPVSTAVDLRAMQTSEDPAAKRDARIISMIEFLQADMARLEKRMYRQGMVQASLASNSKLHSKRRRTTEEFLDEAFRDFEFAQEAVREQQIDAEEALQLARDQQMEAMEEQLSEEND
jgi:hypothetical protein